MPRLGAAEVYGVPVPPTRPCSPARRCRLAAPVVAALLVSGCGVLPAAGPQDASSAGPTPSATEDVASAMPTFDPSSAVAQYAPGFPAELLGAPKKATVLASSATRTEDGRWEVSLSLSTTLGTRKVINRYADRLQEAGFEESDDVDAAGLSARAAFLRSGDQDGTESVLIGVHDDGERRLVSLSGVVRQDA